MMSILPKKKNIFSDEAHFNLNAYVITAAAIISGCFFENKNSASITVNGDTYRIIIRELFVSAHYGIAVNSIWFQVDCTTCHIFSQSIYCINVFKFPILQYYCDL